MYLIILISFYLFFVVVVSGFGLLCPDMLGAETCSRQKDTSQRFKVTGFVMLFSISFSE